MQPRAAAPEIAGPVRCSGSCGLFPGSVAEVSASVAAGWPNVRRYLDGYASTAVTLTVAKSLCAPLFLVARQVEDLHQRLHVPAAWNGRGTPNVPFWRASGRGWRRGHHQGRTQI